MARHQSFQERLEGATERDVLRLLGPPMAVRREPKDVWLKYQVDEAKFFSPYWLLTIHIKDDCVVGIELTD